MIDEVIKTKCEHSKETKRSNWNWNQAKVKPIKIYYIQ